jgi:hypothetical protein
MKSQIKKNRVVRRIVAIQQALSNRNPVIRPKCRHSDPDVIRATQGPAQLEQWYDIFERDSEFLNQALQRRADAQTSAEKPEPRVVYIAGPGRPQSERLRDPQCSLTELFYRKFKSRR